MTSLNDGDRKAIGELADLLIPATPTMPSASDAEVHTKWIDRAFAARPELVDLIRSALEPVEHHGATHALDYLKSNNMEALEVFMGVVTTCYYMHPGVRKRIGYPGQEPVPIAEGEAEYYLADEILEVVVGRGPIYRNVE